MNNKRGHAVLFVITLYLALVFAVLVFTPIGRVLMNAFGAATDDMQTLTVIGFVLLILFAPVFLIHRAGLASMNVRERAAWDERMREYDRTHNTLTIARVSGAVFIVAFVLWLIEQAQP